MRFPDFLFTVILLNFLFIFSYAGKNNVHFFPINKDTATINHKIDGIVSEWPSSKFENDVSTAIDYAIDNDNENLYLAINIPNEGIQAKLEKMGMKLFIDLKGKKKEGRGISFPVKEESAITGSTDYNKAAGITSNDEEKPNPQQKAIDKKAKRSMMAIRLNYMNVFGFDESGAHDQGLKMPGSINVAFAWDTADVLHVEYLIPLKMLESAAELNQKDISIGWRINGFYPSDQYQSREHKQPRTNTSAGYGGSTGFDPTRKVVTRETIIRENNIWSHYTINISK